MSTAGYRATDKTDGAVPSRPIAPREDIKKSLQVAPCGSSGRSDPVDVKPLGGLERRQQLRDRACAVIKLTLGILPGPVFWKGGLNEASFGAIFTMAVVALLAPDEQVYSEIKVGGKYADLAIVDNDGGVLVIEFKYIQTPYIADVACALVDGREEFDRRKVDCAVVFGVSSNLFKSGVMKEPLKIDAAGFSALPVAGPIPPVPLRGRDRFRELRLLCYVHCKRTLARLRSTNFWRNGLNGAGFQGMIATGTRATTSTNCPSNLVSLENDPYRVHNFRNALDEAAERIRRMDDDDLEQTELSGLVEYDCTVNWHLLRPPFDVRHDRLFGALLVGVASNILHRELWVKSD
ncbi:hypothetical protein DFJ73DRAFT_793779 [Zopfochytrium polystomum]|nr:hypothetical protein DFJ73DRAFT_793779 [Zopfochytrium polystomum]